MQLTSALKREASAAPLSTEDEETRSPLPYGARFDRSRLIQELLTLEHPRLKAKTCEQIATEMERDMASLPRDRSPEALIRERLEEKLSSLGVLDPDEAPVPPHGDVKVDARALERLCRNQGDVSDHKEALEHLEALFENVSRIVAGAEDHFKSPNDVETIAVEFFNAMANQEFYPHLPSLLGELHPAAYGAQQVVLPLSADETTMKKSLANAGELWRLDRSVIFTLSARAADMSLESFERFLVEVEKEAPKSVTLDLSAENPRSLGLIRLAASGKYDLKFNFNLRIPGTLWPALKPSARGKAEQVAASLDLLLYQVWNKCNPGLTLCREEPGEPLAERDGGGPALSPYEICQLGTLNVAILASGGDVDWTKLRRMVHTAVHFLDNLIEVTEYPLDTVKEHSHASRKIGISVMGFAELLKKINRPYGGETSHALAEKLMRFIHREAAHASKRLAEIRGTRLNDGATPLRNASLTAVVPTESLAELAGVTAGIEPSEDEITCGERLKMQACFQRHSDGDVALSVPAPESTGLKVLKELLQSAIQLGIRRIQLARNSRLSKPSIMTSAVRVEATGKAEPEPEAHPDKNVMKWVAPRRRPEILRAVSRRIHTGYGIMTVTLGYDEWGPYEIHIRLGKSGSHESAHADALSRLISLLLSSGVEPRRIHEELREIRGPAVARDRGVEVLSIADGIAKILAREFRWYEEEMDEDAATPAAGDEEITAVMEEETLH